jgi:hypothetical protein
MYMILNTINGVVVGKSELPHTSVLLIHDDPSMSKTYPPCRFVVDSFYLCHTGVDNTYSVTFLIMTRTFE